MTDSKPDFIAAAQGLDRIAVDNLRRALEIGRWPDGRAVSAAQREICLQTVIAWERVHRADGERSGHVPTTGACAVEEDEAPRPLRIIGGDQ